MDPEKQVIQSDQDVHVCGIFGGVYICDSVVVMMDPNSTISPLRK